MVRISVVRNIDVSANTSTFLDLYTVPPAKKLTVTDISVSFPVNTIYELKVWFYVNDRLEVPSDPNYPIVGENITVSLKPNIELVSNEKLRVKLQNVNASAVRSCVIKVEGELE